MTPAIVEVVAPPASKAFSTAVDPFTYAVHALTSLLLKDTGLLAVWGDLAYLAVFSFIAMTAATLLFKRTL